MKLNKKILVSIINEVIEEGKGSTSKKMRRKKAQKKKKISQKKLLSAIDTWAELKPTKDEIKEAMKLIKSGELTVEEEMSRLQKIGMVILLAAQLGGQLMASPIGELVTNVLSTSPDIVKVIDPHTGDDGIHGGELTVDDNGDTHTYSVVVDLPDDVVHSIKDSGISEGELTESILNNIQGNDLEGVHHGLTTGDYSKLAESTARAILK